MKPKPFTYHIRIGTQETEQFRHLGTSQGALIAAKKLADRISKRASRHGPKVLVITDLLTAKITEITM